MVEDGGHVGGLLKRNLPLPLFLGLDTPRDAGCSVDPGLVYFHGGGLMTGSLYTDAGTSRSLANSSCCHVVSVDCRLAAQAHFRISGSNDGKAIGVVERGTTAIRSWLDGEDIQAQALRSPVDGHGECAAVYWRADAEPRVTGVSAPIEPVEPDTCPGQPHCLAPAVLRAALRAGGKTVVLGSGQGRIFHGSASLT